MKTLASIVLATTSLASLASLAWASAGGREDHSPLVVWAFLGFCALIVVAQLIPAIRSAHRAASARRMAAEENRAATAAVEK